MEELKMQHEGQADVQRTKGSFNIEAPNAGGFQSVKKEIDGNV